MTGIKKKIGPWGIVTIGIMGTVIWTGCTPKTTLTTYLVTSLSSDENPLSAEFARIDIGRHKNYPLHLPLIDPDSGKEFDISLEEIKRAEFETLTNKVVESWPSWFESREKVPKIRVRIEYLNGASKTYLTYATYWAYLYDQKGSKMALHLCRIKEIQPVKRNRGAN